MPKDTQLPPEPIPGSQPDAGDTGVPKEGMPGGGTSDAGKPDPKQFVPIEQLNKLRSTMDKQVAAQQQQFQQLKEQYDSLMKWREQNETEGLTDEEMVAYQAEKAQYEAQQEIAKARQQADQLAYERNFLALKNYYLSKGAPNEVLSLDEPTEMQEAFLNWLLDRAAKAEAALAQAGQTDQNKGKQPPPVTTHKPAAASSGGLSWSGIKLGSKEEADLMAALESGRVKPEDIAA